MVRSNVSIIINKPIHEVFSYVSDIRHLPRWIRGCQAVIDISPGEIGEGTQFKQKRVFMGIPFTIGFRVIALQKDKRATVRTTTSSIPIEGDLIFEKVPTGTKLTSSDSLLKLPFYLLPFEKLLTWITERETRIALKRVKIIIEE